MNPARLPRLTRLLPLLAALGLLTLASPDPARARPEEARPVAARRLPLAVSPALSATIARTGWARVLVGLASEVSPTAPTASLAAAAEAAQLGLLADLAPAEFALERRYEHFPLLAGRISAAGLARLRADRRVTAIDEDLWLRPLAPAAAPLALAEALPSVGADRVHALGIKGQGIGVAVVDTGVDSDHPDLAEALVAQVCFSSGSRSCAPGGLPRSDSAEDEQGHGTAVSGIVLGRGKAAPVGVAPEAKLIGVRVFRDAGGAPTADIVAGLDWVVGKQNAHNIRVVNMSLGGGAAIGTNCDDQYASVKQVFQTLVSRNVAIFVATGNGGNTDRVAFPACISNATGVGSTYDTELTLSRPDCHGATQVGPTDITCYTDRGRAMDLVAPGSIIVSSRLGGGATGSGPTGGGHGTSFASPNAAGVAALVLSADPSIHSRDLERILKSTGDTIKHPETGADVKRVNAYKAVLSVLPATPTPRPATATATATASPSSRPASPTATTSPATATATEPLPTAPAEPSATSTEAATASPAAPPTTAVAGGWRVYLPSLAVAR